MYILLVEISQLMSTLCIGWKWQRKEDEKSEKKSGDNIFQSYTVSALSLCMAQTNVYERESEPHTLPLHVYECVCVCSRACV